MAKQLITAFLLVIIFSSCQRGCARFNKKFQSTNRHYVIEMYSGGKVVFKDSVYTIVNNSENSDGIYYYKNDTLIEVSGDYIYKSIK